MDIRSPEYAARYSDNFKTYLPEPYVAPIQKKKGGVRTRTESRSIAFVRVALVAAIGVVIAYGVRGYLDTNRHRYVSILDETFSTGLDNWLHDQDLDGNGTGSFEWASANPQNSVIEDGVLKITPTLHEYGEGAWANLTSSNTCTNPAGGYDSCYAIQNATNATMLNPIQTARLRTKQSIRFGKVEVLARMPVGDWLWPFIELQPVDLWYGAWPACGEIDMFHSRGNVYDQGDAKGLNSVESTMHWGPDNDYEDDRSQLTHQVYTFRHSDITKEYHRYGIEWTPKYLRTWVDQKSRTVLRKDFDTHLWYWGGLSYLQKNPWGPGSKAAPFDREFRLSIGLRVGSTNGFFPDNSRKPWSDQSVRNAAMIQFWNAANYTGSESSGWLNTWTKPTFDIKRVQVWQQL